MTHFSYISRFTFCLSIILLCSLNLFAQENKVKSKTSEDKYDKPSHWNQVKISNASAINSDRIDFSPSFYKNGIVFVSSRKKWGEVDKSINETFFDLYYSDLDGNMLPTEPTDFSRTINSDLHEGPCAFNLNGDVMFFTRNNYQNGKQGTDASGKVGTKIYRARKGEYDWEDIEELSFNSNEYSCQHPSLSSDGKRLYFSSNMPGGRGGYDLYFVEWTRNGWSAPVNLGPEINTKDNEAFPFTHDSGFLFYSSDNKKSMGGLDIFMVDLNSEGKWKSIALGTPFNSPMDDFGMLVSAEGEFGFFTSNRNTGNGKDDIYKFSFDGGIPFIKEKVENPSVILVFDVDSKSFIADADVRFFELKSDGGFQDASVYEVTLDNSAGENLNFELLKKELHTIGDPIQKTGKDGKAFLPLMKSKDYMLSVCAEGYDPVEIPIENLFLRSDVQQEIVVPMKKSECISIAAYVKDKVSGKALEGIQVQLSDETERKDKLVYSDAEGRVELCLMKQYKYSLKTLTSDYDPVEISLPALSSNTADIRNLNIVFELERTDLKLLSEPLKEGVTIVLENIYYDFDKSAIRTGDALELDALGKILKEYPSIEIDLIAHTDSRGEKAYNLRLSEERAASARNYLVAKGVDASRIRAIGKGEEVLRNSCSDGVNCTDTEHQYNRRTEVVIRKIKEDSSLRFINNNN
jgi:outer membrane protein OmpA-like peptidoglycan-associated protein/Tol biopolymer transport system component